jgi:hypothetical protein
MGNELILSIGEKMNREKILTDKGLFYLYRDKEEAFQRCLYMAIVLKMTELYDKFTETNKMDRTAYNRLRSSALHYGTILPIFIQKIKESDMERYDKEYTESFNV